MQSDLHCWRRLGFVIFVSSKKWTEQNWPNMCTKNSSPTQSHPVKKSKVYWLKERNASHGGYQLWTKKTAWIMLSSTPTFLPPNKKKSTLWRNIHISTNPRIQSSGCRGTSQPTTKTLLSGTSFVYPSNVVVTLHFLRCPFEHALARNAKNAQLSFISRIANNGSYSRIGASGWMEKRGWQRSNKKRRQGLGQMQGRIQWWCCTDSVENFHKHV